MTTNLAKITNLEEAVRQVKAWGLDPTFAVVERYPYHPATSSYSEQLATVFAYQFMQDGRNVATYIPDMGKVNKQDRVYGIPYTETINISHG